MRCIKCKDYGLTEFGEYCIFDDQTIFRDNSGICEQITNQDEKKEIIDCKKVLDKLTNSINS